jgi:hypothetical protein
MSTRTRTRRIWKPNNEGLYLRQVGWKLSRNGRRVQHKFRFACALVRFHFRCSGIRSV